MPQELCNDINIRIPFISQQSLDEYIAERHRGSRPTDLIGSIGYSALRGDRGTIGEHWLESLDPATDVGEALFLAGMVETESQRIKKVHELLDKATDKAIYYGKGTVGDLLESGAPDIYGQLFSQPNDP